MILSTNDFEMLNRLLDN